MIRAKILLAIVWILVGTTIWFSVTGCVMLRRVSDAIFNKPESVVTVIPETSKGQLWQTIKGLTPNWLAIPVIALGAVAMFNGAAKLGMSCIIFGSVNLFMALATSRFGFWMAVCGLVGSGLAVAASIVAKNKALRQIIFNNQCIKQIAKDDNVDLVFQDKMKEVLAKQVKSTKKIVASVKTKLRAVGKITTS